MIVLAHQNRDVCPTCPTLRETSREKPITSTTTTGRTIVERFSGRDQLPHQQRQGARPRRPPPRSRGRRGGKQHWGLSCGIRGLWRRIIIRYCGDRGFCLHEVAGKSTRPSPTVSWHASRVEGRSQRFTSRNNKRLYRGVVL